MKLDKSTKVSAIVFIVAIIILLSIPLIIEQINPKYITAGEALTFCGGILSASVAIIGVFLTLKYNKEQTQLIYDENQRNLLIDKSMGVYPYLYAVLDNSIVGGLKQVRNYMNSGNYIIIDDDYDDALFFSRVMCNIHNDNEFNEAFLQSSSNWYFCIDIYNITNAGVGTATDIVIHSDFKYDNKLLDISLENEEYDDDLKNGIHHCPLRPSESISLVFCSYIHKTTKPYKFDFSYCDVYGNKFVNKFEFKCSPNKGTKMVESGKQNITKISTLYNEYKNLVE